MRKRRIILTPQAALDIKNGQTYYSLIDYNIINENVYAIPLKDNLLTEKRHINHHLDEATRDITDSIIKVILSNGEDVDLLDSFGFMFTGWSFIPIDDVLRRYKPSEVDLKFIEKRNDGVKIFIKIGKIYGTADGQTEPRMMNNNNQYVYINKITNDNVQITINAALILGYKGNARRAIIQGTLAHELQHAFDQYIFRSHNLLISNRKNLLAFHNIKNDFGITDYFRIKDILYMLSPEEQRACIQWVSNYIKSLDKEKLKEYILNIKSEIINKRLSLEPLFLRIDNIVNIVAHIDTIKSKSKIFVINNLVSILCHRYENDEKKKVNLLVIGAYMFHHGVLNFNITNHKFDKSLLDIIFNKSNVYNYIHDKENVMRMKTIDTVILEFIALNLKHMAAIYTKNIFNAIQNTLADIKLYEQANPNDNNYITEEELTNIYKIDRHFFHRVIIL